MSHTGGQRRLELDFIFDFYDYGNSGGRGPEGLLERPLEQHPVIVLPHDRVGERRAILDPAADAHGINLERPQTRRGLPGVRDSPPPPPPGPAAGAPHTRGESRDTGVPRRALNPT